jgi:hypothetical protein
LMMLAQGTSPREAADALGQTPPTAAPRACVNEAPLVAVSYLDRSG